MHQGGGAWEGGAAGDGRDASPGISGAEARLRKAGDWRGTEDDEGAEVGEGLGDGGAAQQRVNAVTPNHRRRRPQHPAPPLLPWFVGPSAEALREVGKRAMHAQPTSRGPPNGATSSNGVHWRGTLGRKGGRPSVKWMRTAAGRPPGSLGTSSTPATAASPAARGRLRDGAEGDGQKTVTRKPSEVFE